MTLRAIALISLTSLLFCGCVAPPPPRLPSDAFLKCALDQDEQQSAKIIVTNQSNIRIAAKTKLLVTVSEPLDEASPGTQERSILLDQGLEPNGAYVLSDGFGARYRSCKAVFA